MEPKATRMTSIVSLMAVFCVGIAFIIIGSISEEMKKDLEITNVDIGNLTLALFLTSVIVQLIVGPFVDKFGHKPLAIAGFLVSSLSMFMIALASSFQMVFFACILLGIGAMCLNTVGNTLIPVVLFDGKDPARASNFGNAFFGLGYVITPLLFPDCGSWSAVSTGLHRLPILDGIQAVGKTGCTHCGTGSLLLRLTRDQHGYLEQALHDRVVRGIPERKGGCQCRFSSESLRRGNDGGTISYLDD
jgi:MFS family permease